MDLQPMAGLDRWLRRVVGAPAADLISVTGFECADLVGPVLWVGFVL